MMEYQKNSWPPDYQVASVKEKINILIKNVRVLDFGISVLKFVIG